MRIAFPDFPAQQKANFALACRNLGLHPDEFDLEAEVDQQEADDWAFHPHVVVVTHRATSSARICDGGFGKLWTVAFDTHVRRFRFVQR
jgi:hypothetical protein